MNKLENVKESEIMVKQVNHSKDMKEAISILSQYMKKFDNKEDQDIIINEKESLNKAKQILDNISTKENNLSENDIIKMKNMIDNIQYQIKD